MKLALIIPFLLLTSCAYHRISHDQSEMLIEGVDIDESLKIAEFWTNRHDDGEWEPNSLGYWAMRAQEITPEQAKEIDRVYWKVIDQMEYKEFHLWHYTWAIADLYRLGSPEVQEILQKAFDDAVPLALAIEKEKFVADSVLHLGFFHGGGWRAAKNYMVVPGNRKFTQNANEYIEEKTRKGSKY